jgi:hypothetical protein
MLADTRFTEVSHSLSREESIPATRLAHQAVRTVRFWDALLAIVPMQMVGCFIGNAEVAFRQATIMAAGLPTPATTCRSLLLQTLLLSSFEMPVLTTAATVILQLLRLPLQHCRRFSFCTSAHSFCFCCSCCANVAAGQARHDLQS